MRMAYVRVSSRDQNTARQYEVLKPYAIEKYFEEKASGKSTEREQLKAMLKFAREGDQIYIESISRLARNVLDFLTIVKDLEAQGIHVISVKENIDTSSPQGRFVLVIFGALYELERESIRERQAEGIAAAKNNGVRFGRPQVKISDDFKQTYRLWKNGGLTATAAMRLLGMSSSTFYRRVAMLEAPKESGGDAVDAKV